MDNENNDLLILGISILGIGLLLAAYSISTYREIKSLSEKVDFELIDDNIEMSNTDKYYKYLSIADFLNQKLDHNKNILIKNSSCIYLDYAQHNAIELYRLTHNKINMTEAQKSVSAGIVRSLYNKLDNYNTCKQTSEYKKELKQIISEIQNENQNLIDAERRYNNFISTPNIPTDTQTSTEYQDTASQYQDSQIQPSATQDQQQPIENNQIIPAENNY